MKRFALLTLAIIVVALVNHAVEAEPLDGTPLGDLLSGAALLAFWLVFSFLITPANVRCRLMRQRESTRESD